jgi:hypothetical protein
LVPKAFVNEETQHITKYEAGKEYEVEVCVFTTAPYGDRVATFVKYQLKQIDSTSCTLLLCYTTSFVKPVSIMLRPVIQRGVEGTPPLSIPASPLNHAGTQSQPSCTARPLPRIPPLPVCCEPSSAQGMGRL